MAEQGPRDPGPESDDRAPGTPEPAGREEGQAEEAAAGEEPEYAPTPFDGPYVVPVLLAGMAVWFFYDGWFNPEIKSVDFNRWGSGVLAIAAVITGFRAWREERGRPPS